ncbi:MAG: hypothetical protein JXR95_07115 [Deltaproteobacteria bacterium]|nr:hypothetical protein [Deltaproteobacteria bacterium]
MVKENEKVTVWTSDEGRVCPVCSKAVLSCICQSAKSSVILGDGRVVIKLETNKRRGKDVTVISGLPMNESQLKSFSRLLKKKCGAGGTVKNGIIEIQGDKRDSVKSEVIESGFNPKVI